jgi:predicted acetyltransferase
MTTPAAPPPLVTLERATPDSAALLENLLALYMHDLSEIFPVEPGPDGRFRYEHLPTYWEAPDSRHAFLIKSDARIIGFALVMRGSPATDDPRDLDVAEFFVLRRHRRSGAGRIAAFALWDLLPGHWVVRVAESNRAGIPFWTEIIREYSAGAFVAGGWPGRATGWRVFRFESRRPSAG